MVIAACGSIQSTHEEHPEVQGVLTSLGRHWATGLQPRLRCVRRKLVAESAGLPQTLQELLSQSTCECDINSLHASLQNACLHIDTPFRGDGDPADRFAPWQYLAGILRVGPKVYWPPTEHQIPLTLGKSAGLLTGSGDLPPLIQDLLRWYIHPQLKMLRPESPLQTGSFVRYLYDAVVAAKLAEQASAFGALARKTLKDLQISSTADVTLPGGRIAYHVVCAFLDVTFPTDLNMNAWCPKAWKKLASPGAAPMTPGGNPSKGKTRGDTEPFDPRLAIDPQFRTRGAVGCTRKPGSRRENCGHN